MNAEAMREGRERRQPARREEAITRVREYERWLRSGSVLRDIPAIPTDQDYRVARAAREEADR